MKIAMIPIDDRPVCYNLPKEIAQIDAGLEFLLPDRNHLGSLFTNANTKEIYKWLNKLDEVDALIVSLDTIAYGGLIPSRRSNVSVDEIKANLEEFKTLFREKCKGKIYAFSSIMRISNNNINEEEKEYWSEYGEKIFKYSYTFHEKSIEIDEGVPKEIINDYLSTRKRNFDINKMYLSWMEQGIFDTLVFSKDDCSQYGFNVLESEILTRMIKEKNLPALVKTGADEIPLTLFARAICDNNWMPKISTNFILPEHKDLISNYEDISIEKSVNAQIELSGARLSDEETSDIIMIVNNFEQNQGEIVMNVPTKPFSKKLILPQKPYIIADVRFANGSDNHLVKHLVKNQLEFKNFFGYSGWNTSANSLGSLLCAAIIRFFAKNYDEKAFKKVQSIRFLDDWAYQANVRQIIKGKNHINTKELKPDVKKLKKLMIPFEKKLNSVFCTNFEAKYSFPWKRFFEIEVKIK